MQGPAQRAQKWPVYPALQMHKDLQFTLQQPVLVTSVVPVYLLSRKFKNVISVH